MKSDLRRLVAAQQRFFAENGRYANGVPDLGVTESPGVSLGVWGRGTSWDARAMHMNVAKICAIYFGDRLRDLPVANEGEVGCASTPGTVVRRANLKKSGQERQPPEMS